MSNDATPPEPDLIRQGEGGNGTGFLAEDHRKFFSPPAGRNKQPILEVLQQHLGPSEEGTVLEVSSGSGQHVSHFAPNYPKLQFQPTEYPGFASPLAKGTQDLSEILTSIDAYCENCKNVLPAKFLDATAVAWPGEEDGVCPAHTAVITINLCHISPFEVTKGLFAGAGRTLRPGGGLFFLYGPFKFGPGPATPESNAAFDEKLRQLDPNFGIRNVQDIDEIASTHGLVRKATHDMPASNHLLVYEKA